MIATVNSSDMKGMRFRLVESVSDEAKGLQVGSNSAYVKRICVFSLTGVLDTLQHA